MYLNFVHIYIVFCFLFSAPDEKVFGLRRDHKSYSSINGTMRAHLESDRVGIKRDFYLVLGFDLPHHFLWIAYLLMRFKPDRWGGDVIIAPGYDEIREEEREHGPFGAMVDKVLSDKDK